MNDPTAEQPVRVELTAPREMARWRPLVNWILVIPQALVSGALNGLREVLTLIAFFTVLFTETIPRPIFDVIVWTWRYQWRVLSYAAFMREAYPPFDFLSMASTDPGGDAATLSIRYPERLNRWAPLYKWFLAIPHYVVLFVLTVGAVAAGIGAALAVLVEGRYPQGIRDYIVGVFAYYVRVSAYVLFLTDEYPPFTLSSTPARADAVAWPAPGH
jgi:hypothetical protein